MTQYNTLNVKLSGSQINKLKSRIKEGTESPMLLSLEEPGLFIKGVSETNKNVAKEQKGGFLSMLLGTLGASLLGNLLTGKGAIATSQGRLNEV